MPVPQADFSQQSNVAARLREAKINLCASNVFDHTVGLKDAPSLCCWRRSKFHLYIYILFYTRIMTYVSFFLSVLCKESYRDRNKVSLGRVIPPGRSIDLFTTPGTSSYCLGNHTQMWHCSLSTMGWACLHSDSNWSGCRKHLKFFNFLELICQSKANKPPKNIDSGPNLVATGNWPANSLHSG